MNRVIARENGALRLLHSDLYKCALSGSFLLSLLSFFVIPVTLEYGQLHRDLLRGILAADMLFMAAFAIVFAACLGYFAQKQIRKRPFFTHLKRTGSYAAFFAAAAVIYFLLCGGLSCIIYFFLKNHLLYGQIKLIIDIITTVLSVAALPIFVLQLLAFSLSGLPFARTIRAGLAAVKTGYWKVLLIILASAAAGLIFTALFSFVSVAILQRILQIIVFTLLGSAGTYLVYKTGLGIFTKGAGR